MSDKLAERNLDEVSTLTLTGAGVKLYDRLNDFVKNSLREEEHYGKVPGAGSKPVLFKGGAQLLAREANLVASYESIDQTIDHENHFYAVAFKCILNRHGEFIAEGYGACNSHERKYLSPRQDKAFLYNVVMKMAKKRAYVDAVTEAWGLSGIFTQDMEDLEQEIPITNRTQTTAPSAVASVTIPVPVGKGDHVPTTNSPNATDSIKGEATTATTDAATTGAPPSGVPTTGSATSGMSAMSGNLNLGNLVTKEQLAQIKRIRQEKQLNPADVQAKCQRLFGTDVTAINAIMAEALISLLNGNGGNGSK